MAWGKWLLVGSIPTILPMKNIDVLLNLLDREKNPNQRKVIYKNLVKEYADLSALLVNHQVVMVEATQLIGIISTAFTGKLVVNKYMVVEHQIEDILTAKYGGKYINITYKIIQTW